VIANVQLHLPELKPLFKYVWVCALVVEVVDKEVGDRVVAGDFSNLSKLVLWRRECERAFSTSIRLWWDFLFHFLLSPQTPTIAPIFTFCCSTTLASFSVAEMISGEGVEMGFIANAFRAGRTWLSIPVDEEIVTKVVRAVL